MPRKTRVAVVVMGDIGRSPRMLFHAVSLADHGCSVDLIGYSGSRVSPLVTENTNIKLVYVPEPPSIVKYLPKLLCYGFKVLWTILALAFTLTFRSRFHLVLMQNPPGVPALGVCWFVSKMKRAKFVVDWHNYTFSVMEYEHGSKSRFVRLAKRAEGYFGPKADASLCVTHGMRSDLLKRWGVRAVTLYDRPRADVFRCLSVREKHSFFLRMAKEKMYEVFMAPGEEDEARELRGSSREVTAFTYRKENDEGSVVVLRKDRPAILVSGTSWTLDEDFSILLGALERYDTVAIAKEDDKSQKLPDVVAIITGKGPQKSYYLDKIRGKNLRHVQFLTPWLDAEDYPKMLACADIGVSLHTSTSGLDLPMKVVDMFGVGLPVLAKKFPCIDELVKEGENGRLFDSETELANLLLQLLRGFPSSSSTNSANPNAASVGKLDTLKVNLRDLPLVPWEDNWDAIVWPLILELTTTT